jgi:hypothetical protein
MTTPATPKNNFYPPRSRRGARRKYPPIPCPCCASLNTWRKHAYLLWCRDCKRYVRFNSVNPHKNNGTSRREGNAAWRALRTDNGRYKEEWRDIQTHTDRIELLRICDLWNAEERQKVWRTFSASL